MKTGTPDEDERGREDSRLLDGYKPERQLTARAVFAGLVIGAVLCVSNTYFGLQTGWVTTGSLPAALIGFAAMKVLGARNFTVKENVCIQTTAVASATMPLAAGFIGVVVALIEMDSSLSSLPKMLMWALSVSLPGVFLAVPFRKQFIIKEKLRFPTGLATATMISTLHGSQGSSDWQITFYVLALCCGVSAVYFLASFFFPILANVPVLVYLLGSDWGLPMSAWGWTLRPAFSYIGQGMIMGTNTALSAGLGALFGWGYLGPMARASGWAPGPIMSFRGGAQGWVLWVSLAIMVTDGIVSTFISLSDAFQGTSTSTESEQQQEDSPDERQLARVWKVGLAASTVVCLVINHIIFGVQLWKLVFALVIASFVTVVALRSMGKTDYNPVSGLGKISQILFMLVRGADGSKTAVMNNLLAGAVAEAGACQAGDLLQDVKTGYLLGASPMMQLMAQIIGSLVSVFVATAAFYFYGMVYKLPGPVFPVPASAVWMDMAQILNHGLSYLAPHVIPFIGLGCAVGLFLAVAPGFVPGAAHLIPSGIAFAIGMYLPPSWTIPRVVGGLLMFAWKTLDARSCKAYGVIVASGFIVGEGLLSLVTAMLHSFGVSPLSCFGCRDELVELGVQICVPCKI